MINQNFNNDKGLHFVHMNIRSLFAKGKLNTLRAQLVNSNTHIFSLSETWLNYKIPSSMLGINGFQICRVDRENSSKKRGGGLAMYIADNIPFDSDKFSSLNITNNNIELQCMALNFKHMREMVVLNLYRPPQGSVNSFIEYLSKIITSIYQLCKKNVEIYFMGDFNLDFSDTIDKNVKDLIQLMKSTGNKPLIDGQTRIGKKSSCLDQIFTNSDYITNSGILDVNLSDHLAIFCTRKKIKILSPKINFEGRSYRNYIKEDFQHNLINSNWNDFYSSNDPEICWEIMEAIIREEIDKMCPLKNFRVSKSRDVWITNELLEEIRDKDLALKRARKSGDANHWAYARHERNRVGKLIDKARADYFEEEERHNRGDPKRFWHNISSVLPSKKSGKHTISLHDFQTDTEVAQNNIPEYVNTFFTNIGPNLAKSLNTNWEFTGEVITDAEITSIHTDFEEVYNLCKEINISKSSAIETLSSKIIKDAFLVLALQLVYMFNLSLIKKSFPKKWKIATVVPLYKGGNQKDVSNFRPISLLPLPGKLLERIVHSKLSHYLELNEILCNEQCGFRKERSTVHSIVNLTNSLLNAINDCKTCTAVFIDLKKAFDTINHSILLRKLEYMGVKGDLLLWINDYLHDRSQKSIVNGRLSNNLPISCGVPQGSILGPLFFIAYINDMQNYLNTKNLGLYADDTVLISHADDINDLQDKTQEMVNKFQKWCEMNILTINIKKTKFMIFGTRSRIKKAKNIKITISGQHLQQVPSYKYLGVTLDSVLTYSKHISTVLNTVSHKAYILSKIRHFITTYSALRIYKSMILPYFDYADIVFAKANQSDLEKLQRLQNRCLKTCLLVNNRTDTDYIHSVTKIAKLEFRRKIHLRNFMYLQSKNNCLLDVKSVNTRLRDAPLFKIKIANVMAYERSVQHNGALEWNNLPIDVRNVDQYLSFKLNQLKWLHATYQL